MPSTCSLARPGDTPTGKRQSPGKTCKPCRELKIKCTGSWPCDRCWRLALQCIPPTDPQGRGRGRPPAASFVAAVDWPLSPPRLMDMVIHFLDPRPIAELLARSFIARHRDGLVVRDNVVRILRHWMWKSAQCGDADVSWGALGQLTREMGLSSLELAPRAPAGEHEALGAMPLAGEEEGLRAVLEQAAALRQSAVFKDAERHGAAIYMAMPSGERLIEASNGLFQQWFRGVEELYTDMVLARTLNGLLLCGLVAPQDRAAFVETLIDLQVTRRARRVREIVKFLNLATGGIELFIMEARPVDVQPDGVPVGLLVRLERCPPSKYVSASGHHRISHSFRPVAQPPPGLSGAEVAVEESIEWACDGSSGIIPGTAAVPLPPLSLSKEEASALAGCGPFDNVPTAFFKRPSDLFSGPDGAIAPPSPPSIKKRRRSLFGWTRPGALPPLVLPPLSATGGAASTITPRLASAEEGGGSEGWEHQAVMTPRGRCWPDGGAPPILEEGEIAILQELLLTDDGGD